MIERHEAAQIAVVAIPALVAMNQGVVEVAYILLFTVGLLIGNVLAA